MAFPSLNITGLSLKWAVLADDIAGVGDGGAVTTEWEDRVAEVASAIESGSPAYVADAFGGHAGVRFTRANNDILKWPLADYGDSHCLIVAGVFTDTGAVWATAIALQGSGDPTNERTLLAHRHSGADQYAEFNALSSDETRAAGSSTPVYTPNLDIFCSRHGADDELLDWFYKAAGTYGLKENDAYVSFGESFDHVYVGGDASSASNAMSGDILFAAVCEVTSTTNADNDALTALLQDIEDYFNTAFDPPAAPDLTLESVTNNDVTFSTDDFVPGEGGEQSAAQWLVTTDADTGYAAPVINVTSTTKLQTAFFEDLLAPGTDYRAKMAKKEAGGAWSPFSNEVTFTTQSGPAKPTISIVSQAGDHIVWESSVYSGDAAQAGAHWQVTLAADTGFASPIKDHETVAPAEFEDYTSVDLSTFFNVYIGRVRHLDVNGIYSDWSDASASSAPQASGQFYTAFAERPVGTDISTDVPADWEEVWADDFSLWPIIAMADATCKVVVDRTQEVGDDTAVDPIFWQGFPAVDQQEVFVRLKFPEQAAGGGGCVGEASPGGFMCRTTLGLVRRDELPDMDEWRIVRSGIGGEWDFYPDRGHQDGSGAETAGQNAIGFRHQGGHSPTALVLWDGAGTAPVGYWFQVAHKIADLTRPWYDSQWNGVAVASESDSEQYVCEMLHACGLFKTWDYQAIYARVVNTLLTFKRGQRTTEAYQYLKAARTDAGRVQMYSAFSSRRAHGAAGTLSVADTRWGAGEVGLAVNACSSQPGAGLSLFSHPTLCRGNKITVVGLPVGARLEIDYGGGTLGRLAVTGTGSTVELDFGGNAWPYTTYYLYDADGNLLEAWTPTTNPGVWGGDVITIGIGALGVGKIGGAAARLQPATDVVDPGGGGGEDFRLTEAGDFRLTEAGDKRLLE